MSGSPKYSRAELERRRQQELEKERQRLAEIEGKKREAEAQSKRQIQLQKEREKIALRFQILTNQQKAADIYSKYHQTLKTKISEYQAQLKTASNIEQLGKVTQVINQLQKDLEQAIRTKRRDEEAKKIQAELEQQSFELQELEHIIAQIPPQDAQKFDPSNHAQIPSILSNLHSLLINKDAQKVRDTLQQAIILVQQHETTVNQQREIWQQRQEKAAQKLYELEAIQAGMQADPKLTLWQPQVIQRVLIIIEKAQQSLNLEQFETLEAFLEEAQSAQQEALEKANQAQLKAETRDYITDSIAQSLEAMGFEIVYREPEYADHPASSTILTASSAAGKRISVSVPVEGEVFYDVNGYSKNTVATLEGGTAKTCDEAEQVLEEMHQVLADAYGVQMGEILWDDKKPHDRLVEREDLPRSSNQTRQTGR